MLSKTVLRRGSLASTAIVGVVASVIALDVSGVLSLELGAPRERRAARKRTRISFADATREVGLAFAASPTWGATWADHDRDGWPDLLIGRHKRVALENVNSGGRYERAADRSAFEPPGARRYYDRHACSWGEADGDGLSDLFCVSGAQKGVGTGPNQLLLGRGPEVAASAGVRDRFGRGRSVNWIDFDSDGDLDLFVGNQVRAGFPNLTFRNSGGVFTAVDVGLTEERATSTSAWSDWDRDGDPDLLVLGHGLRGSSAYENRAGRFVEVQMEGVTGQTWRAAAWGDYDGDGYSDLNLVDDGRVTVLHNRRGRMETAFARVLDAGRAGAWLDADNDADLDLFVVQGKPAGSEPRSNLRDRLFVNHEGRFRPVSAGVSGTRVGDGDAVVVADSDRDGRVDLFVTNGSGESDRGPWRFLRNRSRGGHWIGLTLVGDDRNPFGFGARIRARTESRVHWTELTDASGSEVQSDPGYAHLGLGRARAVSIRIEWPDGTVDCYRGAVDRVVRAVKGRSPCS